MLAVVSTALLFLLVPAAVGVGFALILGIILFASRRRPEQHGWVATPAGGQGTWNAEVLGEGGLGAGSSRSTVPTSASSAPWATCAATSASSGSTG